MFFNVCARACVLISVGRRKICLLAASFRKVLFNRDKEVACGKIERRMFFSSSPSFWLAHGQKPWHNNEGKKNLKGKESNLQEKSDD